MIKSTFGLTREPFYRSELTLLAQDVNVMGVTRDGVTHTRLKGLRLREGDEVLYVGARRYAWEEMAALGA